MRRQLQISAGIFILCAGSTALAQEEDREMKISLGYVGTSGNTETETFNGEFLATWNTNRWTHNFKFQGLGAKDEGVTTAERYYLEQKSDFNLSELQYLYGKATYTDDRFSGFNYQATVSTGYGRHLINRDNLTMEAFAGVGYRQSETVEVIEEGVVTPSMEEGEAIFTLGEKLEWIISDSSSLYQSLNTEIGNELTVTVFEIGLESVIMGSLSSRIAYQARHNSQVPPEKEKLDTQTSVSLVYEF